MPWRSRGSLAEHHGVSERVHLPRRLVEELGVLPSPYLHYFYRHDEVLAEQREGTPRAATVAEIERELLELYRDPALVEKPVLLEQRGGAFYSEAATALVASLAAGTGDLQVVDVRNAGAVPGLADDDVVELLARITAGASVSSSCTTSTTRVARSSSTRTGACGHARRSRTTATPARASAAPRR